MTEYSVTLTGIHARNEKTIQATQDWERSRIDEEGLRRCFDEDVSSVVKLQRGAGVDVVTDGQLTLAWQDLFRPISRGFAGLEPGPMVRWFNTNTFFFTPVVKGAVSTNGKALIAAVETKFVDHGSAFKVVIPDPLTFVRLSDDRHYKTREKLLFAYAEAVNAELKALSSLGARYVQFSAPGLVYTLEDRPLPTSAVNQLGEAIRVALKGVAIRSGFYPFFGDASPYLPRLFDTIPTDDIGVDLTQTDNSALTATSKGLIAGIADSRTTYLEDVEALASRVEDLADRTGAKTIALAPSSDLRFIPRVSADEKLQLLGRLKARLEGGAKPGGKRKR